MKALYTLILFLITFSITHSQDITATLGGNTSTDGFSVVNAQVDTVFRVTGEGNVGINTATPLAIFDVQGGIANPPDTGRGINLIAESSSMFTGSPGGSILLKSGGSGGGWFTDFSSSEILINGGKRGEIGGNIDIFSGNGYQVGGDINIISSVARLYKKYDRYNPILNDNITQEMLSNYKVGDINIGTVMESNLFGGNISIYTGNSNAGGGAVEISTGNTASGGGNDITLRTGDVGVIGLSGGNIILETGGDNYSPGQGDIILIPTPNGGLVKINGSGTYTGSWTQASDERFKKNIEPLKNSVDKVKQLNGISYEFKSEEFPDKNFADGKQIGLIAQEVEKVFPELVKSDNEGYKSVAYQNLVAVLIEAVKEQQLSIDKLNKEVELLKSSIDGKSVEVSSLGN